MKNVVRRPILLCAFWSLGGLWISSPALLRPVLAQEAKAPVAAPRKLALLVGINEYERGRGKDKDWWNLHTEGDISALKSVLMEHFGFAAKDILVLTDAQATRQGILDAFKHQLVDQARPGDVVLFHYSGHGQQVPDPTHRKLNGMHQGFVPYDYLSQSAADGVKSNLLDDQMRDMLSSLKTKMAGPDGQVQGNITVFLDSCFSGTATRGGNGLPRRGRGWDEKIDGPKPQATDAGVDSAGLLDRGEATAQGYVVISATRSDQTAQEARDEKGRPMGALTYYLTRALQQATPKTTYRALFEKVSSQASNDLSGQDPQMEGEADKLLFAGTALPPQNYLVVQKVNGKKLTLPAGLLQGASVGSRYALFRAGSDVTDAKNLLAEADVAAVDDITSQAEVTAEYTGKVKDEELVAARAVETAHNFGENQLKVYLDGKGAWRDTIEAAVAKDEINVMTTEGATADSHDVVIRVQDKQLAVYRRDNPEPLALIANDESATGKIRDVLVGEWRWRYLGGLGATAAPGAGSLLQVEMQLQKLDVPADAKQEENRMVLHYGDRYVLKLRNLSPVDAYITVLDLSPDGTINPVLPPNDMASSELNRVPADGQWHVVNGFSWAASAPPGREMWKAIATKEPADFRSLLLQKTQTNGGELLYPKLVDLTKRGAPPNPLEKILLSSRTGIRQRGFTSAPPAYWTTAQVSFEVLP